MTTATVYATDPVVYLDFTYTSTTDTYGTGYRVTTNLGRIQWVRASATITEGQVLYLTTNASTGVISADLLTTTISGSVVTDVAIAQKAIASGSYGWAWIGPFTNVEVLTTSGIAVGTPLTTHTVAGTASTGGDVIFSLAPLETSVAGLTQCIAPGRLATNV